VDSNNLIQTVFANTLTKMAPEGAIKLLTSSDFTAGIYGWDLV